MLNCLLSAPMTLGEVMICLGAALGLGIMLALVFTGKEHHSAGFVLTLSILPVVVAVVIMMVNGNIGAAVAVSGAFTLVRFRSAQGTAKEIAALFTEMAIGLALGMGYVGVAVILAAVVACAVLGLEKVHFGEENDRKQMKILLPETADYNHLFDDVFRKYGVGAEMKRVRTANMGTLIELTYLLSFPGKEISKDFLDELRVRNGNLTVSIGPVGDDDKL